LRGIDLFKLPGVAETIDWDPALMQLYVLTLTPEAINDTLGVFSIPGRTRQDPGREALRLLNQVKAEPRRRRRRDRAMAPPASARATSSPI